jgi:hypothetical protein
MKQDELDRLRHIRDQRKTKALERVAASQAALQRAEQTLAEASVALEAQRREARERESGGLSAIMGKTLSHAEIADFHAQLVFLSEQLDTLHAMEKEVEQKRDAARSDLKAANAVFRQRHKSVEKLQYVILQERQRHQSRHLALSEAVDDEHHYRSKRSGQGKRAFDIGIGDA